MRVGSSDFVVASHSELLDLDSSFGVGLRRLFRYSPISG